MPLTRLLADFELLKSVRRSNVHATLARVGRFALDARAVLDNNATAHAIPWQGQGSKHYSVYTLNGMDKPWSRAVNTDLFILDAKDFATEWAKFDAACKSSAGQRRLVGMSAGEVDSVIYTAVMSWAVSVDLLKPSNGLGGTYFEMLVGPTIAALSGRPETGDVTINLPGGLGTETVKTDLTFHDPSGTKSLAVPTKISTRERISQAYVHAAILESAFPGRYKTVLCIGNENNAFHNKGVTKAGQSVHTLFLRDTLVPGTIALYQKYIAPLSGLYYLDPPAQYLVGTASGFPHVSSIGQLLVTELPSLL